MTRASALEAARARRRRAVRALALLMLGASGCARQEALQAPNVLLVTIETLRADHVSAYGYPRRTTPFLESMAAEGVLFETVHATSSWTLPSLTSILTSTYSSEHGVGARGPTAGSRRAIPEQLEMLPEILQARGYRTYGLSASLQTKEERGFARGFDRFESLGTVGCRRVIEHLEPWLPELNGEAWFLWLHLFDPHGPYHPREPFLSEFWPAERERHAEIETATPQELFTRRHQLSSEQVEYMEALYDSEIRHADSCLGDLYQALPSPQEILFLATSDHGEEFMERGHLLHAQTLYEESIRIPLILRPPGGIEALRVSRPVSLVDVAPTILAAVGAEVPRGYRGRPLYTGGEEPISGRLVFSELLTRSELRTVSDGRWKLMRDGSLSRLFDLAEDPAEGVDRTADQRERALELSEALDRFEARNAARARDGADVEASPEEIEALRALGYVD